MTIKEIQAEYLVSSSLKDIYLYLAQNKLSSNKMAIKKLEALAEKYILLDSFLFKIVSNPDKEAAVLAILEVCPDKIITLRLFSDLMKCSVSMKACLCSTSMFCKREYQIGIVIIHICLQDIKE